MVKYTRGSGMWMSLFVLVTLIGNHHDRSSSVQAFPLTTNRKTNRQRGNTGLLSIHGQQQESSDGFKVTSTTKRKPTKPTTGSWNSALFRQVNNHHDSSRDFQRWSSGAMVAATILSTAAVGTMSGPLPAQASLDLSPGTTVIETSIAPKSVLPSTVGAVVKLSQTALAERSELQQSITKLASSVSAELSSTKVWRDLFGILQQYYDTNIHSRISIRPPQDLRLALQELVQDGKANFIVNGEVVQLSLEYRTNDGGTPPTGNDDADKSTGPVPDEEWIVRVEGYRGVDPTVIDRSIQKPKYDPGTPVFLQDFWEYYNTPYPEKYLSDFLIPKPVDGEDGGRAVPRRPVTYGDILVLEGTLSVAFLYAWSYAHYLDQIEQQERAVARSKQGRATKPRDDERPAAPTAKPTKQGRKEKKTSPSPQKSAWASPPPPPAASIVEEPAVAAVPVTKKKTSTTTVTTAAAAVVTEKETTDDAKKGVESDVKVSIDFDSTGQMVITATETRTIQSRGGVVAFVQALCFPWLGLIVPSLTARTITTSTTTTAATGTNNTGGKEGLLPFTRALLFPWLGVFRGE